MNPTLEDIQKAVTELPKGDYGQFRVWFMERDWALWDKQIEEDSNAGKFDDLVERALAEKADRELRDL